MRTLVLLNGYVRIAWLRWLTWRGFALTLVANQVVPPLIGLAVWTTALPDRHLSTYYVALLLVRLLTVSYEDHTLAARIYEGTLADDLLRPHPAIVSALAENLAIRLWHLTLGLPLLLGAALLAPVAWDEGAAPLAALALLLATAIRFLFTYALALTAFWIERADRLVAFGGTLIFLLGGEAAPVRLLPGALRPWAEALPFRAMLGFPAELLAGGLTSAQVRAGFGWQLLWLGTCAAAAGWLWRAGVRRYTAVGG